MTDNPNDGDSADISTDGSLDVQTAAVTSNWKVLGQHAADHGVGVLGQNDATSGTPYGVEGAVPNTSDGYGLYTADDAKVDGTTELATLAGSLTGGKSLTDLAGNNLQINSGSLDASGSHPSVSDDGTTVVSGASDINFASNLSATDDGDSTVTVDASDDSGIESLSGGTGIDPPSIGDGDTLSVAWGDATDLDTSGAIVSDAVDTNELATPFADLATLVGTPVAAGGSVDLGGKSLNNTGAVDAPSGSSLSVAVDSTMTAMEITPGGSDVSDGGLESSAPNVVIGGPSNNTGGAGPSGATICGGQAHEASADNAIVCGGYGNVASGLYAFAAGVDAYAENDNVFVWNDLTSWSDVDGDGTTEGLTSAKAVDGEPVTGSSTFSVGASGGVRMVTGSSSVTYIDGGTAGWSNTSSRTTKTNVDSINPQDVLTGVTEMEVATWEYKDEDGDGQGVRHIGPMAEDFHDIVDVGSSDDHINSINADGVAFAAIQGLSEKLDDKEERIDNLEAENEELRERNDELEERLEALEDHLGIEEAGGQPAPADD